MTCDDREWNLEHPHPDAWVQEERERQQRQRRDHLQRITWHSVQTAWALDATEWPTGQPGLKLQVLAARDLASNYGLGLWALPQLGGQWVAQALDQLIRRHGPPLFLKRDNGAPLHTPAVEEVLAQAAVLPLDSPACYPQYNGGMEKHIGDVKRVFPYPLPQPYAGDLPKLRPCWMPSASSSTPAPAPAWAAVPPPTCSMPAPASGWTAPRAAPFLSRSASRAGLACIT